MRHSHASVVFALGIKKISLWHAVAETLRRRTMFGAGPAFQGEAAAEPRPKPFNPCEKQSPIIEIGLWLKTSEPFSRSQLAPATLVCCSASRCRLIAFKVSRTSAANDAAFLS